MFPDWMKDEGEEVYSIDADKAYPAILAELKASIEGVPGPEKGVTELPYIEELRALDINALSQYWVEVAYQMAKLDLRRILMLEGKNAWPRMIRIRTGYTEVDGQPVSNWHMSRFPAGRGIEAATQGKEAREHYRRLRGFIPN